MGITWQPVTFSILQFSSGPVASVGTASWWIHPWPIPNSNGCRAAFVSPPSVPNWIAAMAGVSPLFVPCNPALERWNFSGQARCWRKRLASKQAFLPFKTKRDLILQAFMDDAVAVPVNVVCLQITHQIIKYQESK